MTNSSMLRLLLIAVSTSSAFAAVSKSSDGYSWSAYTPQSTYSPAKPIQPVAPAPTPAAPAQAAPVSVNVAPTPVNAGGNIAPTAPAAVPTPVVVAPAIPSGGNNIAPSQAAKHELDLTAELNAWSSGFETRISQTLSDNSTDRANKMNDWAKTFESSINSVLSKNVLETTAQLQSLASELKQVTKGLNALLAANNLPNNQIPTPAGNWLPGSALGNNDDSADADVADGDVYGNYNPQNPAAESQNETPLTIAASNLRSESNKMQNTVGLYLIHITQKPELKAVLESHFSNPDDLSKLYAVGAVLMNLALVDPSSINNPVSLQSTIGKIKEQLIDENRYESNKDKSFDPRKIFTAIGAPGAFTSIASLRVLGDGRVVLK